MNAKYQLTCRNLVFLTCLLIASWAQAATFNVSFFDGHNTHVGQGQFTVDFNKTICVEVHVLGNCNNNPSLPMFPGGPNQYEFGYVVDRQNPLTDFSATIQGISWGFEAPGKTWLTGSQLSHRYGVFVREDFWFFGDANFGLRQLYMTFNQTTGSSGSGTWGQQVGYDQNRNPYPEWVYGNGTWAASVVPVPAALWLFGSGLVALGALRRKKM